MMESAVTALSLAMPKGKTITQIRPDDQNKGKGKAQSQRQ